MVQNITICKTEFSLVFKPAAEETFTLQKCRSAFESCGVYPYNPYAINSKRLMPSDLPASVPQPAPCQSETPPHKVPQKTNQSTFSSTSIQSTTLDNSISLKPTTG